MERLKLIQKAEFEPDTLPDKEENPRVLQDFKAVVRSLTEDALKVLNKIAADEMNKPEPNTELVEDYYLLFHYLDFTRRFVSGKM
jgi:hypothetical protein